MYMSGMGAEYDYEAVTPPPAATPIWRQVVTALPSLVQSGAQIATAFRSTNAPVGTTPMYVPQYQPQQPQQYQASMFGMDPLTMGLLAGGALLVIVLMKR